MDPPFYGMNNTGFIRADAGRIGRRGRKRTSGGMSFDEVLNGVEKVALGVQDREKERA